MAKDKYDFIQELLENKKLKPAQQERILMLTKEEIKKDGVFGKELEERVKKLEMRIEENKNQEFKTKEKTTPILKKESVLPKYVASKNLWKFLHDYNQDQILKTTCHEIDSNELKNILRFCGTNENNFQQHQQKVQEHYRNHFFDNKKYFVDHKIKNLILYYLTGKTYGGASNGWTDEKIKFNWNSEELKIWSDKNPNLVPHPNDGFAKNQNNNYGLMLENSIKVHLVKDNQSLRYFSQIVLYFKSLFHIRFENSIFNIIENCNKSNHWADKVEFIVSEDTFPKNLEFFTNVEKLIQAYKILMNLIIEVGKENNQVQPIVELKLLETENGIDFSIHHINSIFKKSVNNTIDRKGTTFTNLILNQLNGMCEFYLKADFGNKQFAEINIWDGKKSNKKDLDQFNGVEYILKFKKR